ncbi:ABC transporter substrate-binding protein [Echinicola jeungdonensis]|uniref:ABC transporter substrate-binding protein n=1 Tax=Echinicola jeungdonensis TaxID=709343 RepID=A0ABV5J0Y4_9BACT|nr:ABC transporter substrate-binding protein [Echinicola jeungdonensis]MDN3668310.1 ABC transporter substrate-binding protein [Echinicola jeungdonensis]
MKQLIGFLMAFFVSASLMAQEATPEYRRAKQMIENGNSEAAMGLLRPYLDYREYGELALYARYHFARAAFQNRQYALSQATLSQLVNEYNWEKEDDARYLLALNYFNQKEYFDALTVLNKIRDAALKEEGQKASYDYLKGNVSVSFLVAHWNTFKDNKGYSKVLLEKLEQQTVMSNSEKRVFRELQEMKQEELQIPTSQNIKNNILEVAIILPFNYQGGTGVRNIEGNNFVFELYQGISMAIEEAKKRGEQLTVRTFDSERNEGVVRKILDDPFFQVADIIIGPIYPEETSVVANFAESNQIPYINPLSNIKDQFDGMDYSYLFRPSTGGIVQRVLEFCRNKNIGNKVALAYSGSTRDELMAGQFVKEAKNRGYEITYNRKVNSNNIRDFLEDVGIREDTVYNADMVVIFSDDPYIASPTFSLLESLTTDIPIMVMDSWLYFNFVNFEMLGGNDFHYIGNNTIKMDKESVSDFREKFFEKFQTYPNINAYLGYELMDWVAHSLNNRLGFDFRNNLNQLGDQQGTLSFGLNFSYSQYNQHIPILKMNQGKLEEIK